MLLVVGCAVLGLLVGSFLNVVIARVPDGASVVHPPSHCPRCTTPIAPRDNVPVLSWLALRGRARCCGERISVRYPLVEAGTALAFAGVALWWRRACPVDGAAGVVLLVLLLGFAALSISLALIDIGVFRLPWIMVAPSYPVVAVLLGAAALLAHEPARAVRMVVGALALWGLYRVLNLIRPDGMGMGDVRLAGVLGLVLAWFGWPELLVGAFGGFLLGAVGGIALTGLRRGWLKKQIPYGPWMLLGAWVGLLAGQGIARAYLDTLGA